jgi:Lar family restriction alleviation protein
MSGEHKPCPFCGQAEVKIDTLNYTSGLPGRFRAQCQQCGAVTRWFEDAGSAWAIWDARVSAAKEKGKAKEKKKPSPEQIEKHRTANREWARKNKDKVKAAKDRRKKEQARGKA